MQNSFKTVTVSLTNLRQLIDLDWWQCHFVPLNMKGCICHFIKWQIHPFISKVTTCRTAVGAKPTPRQRLNLTADPQVSLGSVNQHQMKRNYLQTYYVRVLGTFFCRFPIRFLFSLLMTGAPRRLFVTDMPTVSIICWYCSMTNSSNCFSFNWAVAAFLHLHYKV